MPYTFIPDKDHAKAYVHLKISTKSAQRICAVIRKKPLARVKRLLDDLNAERRSLDGKYYSKTVAEILSALHSCEKNAEHRGLELSRLMVHASAHQGPVMRRRRRKSAFGNKMKSTNLEIILVQAPEKRARDEKADKKLKQTSDAT